jgi:hypothetical protein
LRKNKDILRIHKIKPLTELEDDLANKDKISIKTFVALCIFENINILLVNNPNQLQVQQQNQQPQPAPTHCCW